MQERTMDSFPMSPPCSPDIINQVSNSYRFRDAVLPTPVVLTDAPCVIEYDRVPLAGFVLVRKKLVLFWI